jgi:hypothetical protein
VCAARDTVQRRRFENYLRRTLRLYKRGTPDPDWNTGLEVPEIPRRGLDLKGQVIPKIRLLPGGGSKMLFPSNLDRGEETHAWNRQWIF